MTETYTAPNGTTFRYSPDLNGPVRIVATAGTSPTRVTVEIDGPDLAEFVAHVIGRRIDAGAGASFGQPARPEQLGTVSPANPKPAKRKRGSK